MSTPFLQDFATFFTLFRDTLGYVGKQICLNTTLTTQSIFRKNIILPYLFLILYSNKEITSAFVDIFNEIVKERRDYNVEEL